MQVKEQLLEEEVEKSAFDLFVWEPVTVPVIQSLPAVRAKAASPAVGFPKIKASLVDLTAVKPI